ncbi:dual specificity protein phosphatase family protein [bacterium]|nr:dual specificity protein phosphatase family protein [bacterium]
MRRIAPLPVWIGNAGDARDLRRVHAEGLAAIVDLAAEEPPVPVTRELMYFRVPLMDGAENDSICLNLAINTVFQLITRQVPTLVACSAGMSRSPLIVAAAISRVERISLETALERITMQGAVDLSPGLLAAVQSKLSTS